MLNESTTEYYEYFLLIDRVFLQLDNIHLYLD